MGRGMATIERNQVDEASRPIGTAKGGPHDGSTGMRYEGTGRFMDRDEMVTT